MELHQIRYFYALSKELNYTAAAKRCYISRQALRQTVQALEKEYGVMLIENRRNRLCLTPAGELFARHAEAILSDCDELEKTMHRFTSANWVLKLGISVSLLPFYAPDLLNLIPKLRGPFPGLEIEYTTADADTLLDQLSDGSLDAAILVDLGSEYPGLSRTVLQREKPGLLVSVDHPLASRKNLRLKDLDGQTISLMSEPVPCFRALVDALEEQGVHVQYRVIHESIEAFRAVRRDGVLSIDRVERQDDMTVAMEIDLPLTDFQAELETVMLLPEPTVEEHALLAGCLQKIVEGETG